MNLKKLLITTLLSVGIANSVFAETDAEKFNRGVQYYKQGNYVKAFPLFKELANAGTLEAQVFIGMLYRNGQGVEKDAKQAAYWFQKSAEQGDQYAQFYMGVMYDKGEGVEKDVKQAIYWYQKAARQGNSNSLYNLGLIYGKGLVVEKDLNKATKYMKFACDRKLQEACDVLKELSQ